jgi:riboflavin synthase
MFTGLIEDIGRLVSRRRRGVDETLEIETAIDVSSVKLGDSIAINGACLTVTSIAARRLTFDASVETLARTALGDVSPSDAVHVERAMRLSDRLDGHLVLGHVDGVGRVRSVRDDGRSHQVWIDVDATLLREMVEKGSVAIDGVSLTINELDARGFRVTIVPWTAERTLLVRRRPGSSVNIETDIIAKYVRRLVGGADSTGSGDRAWQLLLKQGWTGGNDASGHNS